MTDAIARTLLDMETDEEKLAAASEVAEAQMDLLRIRTVRTELMAGFDPTLPNLAQLQRVVSLDRYARLVATKRRRAARKLLAAENSKGISSNKNELSRLPAKRSQYGPIIKSDFCKTNPIFRGDKREAIAKD